jgi:tryptophanyl-tRNA synthetase
MAKKVIFSGIQPSGELHIGNYLGAIQNWLRLLDEYDCIFCIVDYHAITAPYDQKELPTRVYEAAVAYIASGLVPERCTVFVQSDVPEHTELEWLLGTVTPIGDLFRMTQYKDKSKDFGQSQSVASGLLCYPILQAADILLYKAAAVPVGEDQAQHLELTREIARNFNRRFGAVFPEPATLLSEAKRVLGVDGERKMSKSLGNHIGLTEAPEQIWEKLRTAKTDPARIRRSDKGDPDKCNIFNYHRFFTPKGEQDCCAEGCRTAAIGCVDCKKVLFTQLRKVLDPVRERANEVRGQRDYVLDALDAGARHCKEIATRTIAESRAAMGMLPRR